MIDISQDVLKQAAKIIQGERQEDYGSAEDSFALIAEYWCTYLNDKPGNACTHISGHDVAMMMILLKVARTKGKKKQDNYFLLLFF